MWFVTRQIDFLAFALCAATVFLMSLARPAWGLFAVPAFWPLADLAPWTGHIHATESDLLMLSATAGVFARQFMGDRLTAGGSRLAHSPIAYALGLLLAVSYAVSSSLVLQPLPDLDATLLLGYDTAANSLRLSKALPLAALYCTAVFREARIQGEGASGAALAGLLAGLLAASLAAVMERAAFPGLSNFSADYRTTAPFWEMHVGGAALDGWLILTLPVMIWMLLKESRPRRAALLLIAAAIVAYAIFTTFTRVTYLGATIAFIAMLWQPNGATAPPRGCAFQTIALLFLTAATVLTFTDGGYRGLIALAGLATCIVLSGSALRKAHALQWSVGTGIGATFGLIGAAISGDLPKGPYIAFAACACTSMFFALRRRPASEQILMLTALAVLSINVSRKWNPEHAWLGALAGTAVLCGLALVHSLGKRGLWEQDTRSLVRVCIGIGVATGAAVASGSYYLGERVSTLGDDLDGRLKHFEHSIGLAVSDTDRLIGLGVGRYPYAYFWNVPRGQYPGKPMLLYEEDVPYLRISGPRHVQGFGELFRMTQKAPRTAQGPLQVVLEARSDKPVSVSIELCRKWLIYEDGCTIGGIKVSGDGRWARYEGSVPAKAMHAGPWYAPRLSSLSVVGVGAATLDIRDISVSDALLGELIGNGRFTHGVDNWFFTSDRHHLPWHAKNLWVHLWVEQGILGLLAWTSLFLAVFARAMLRRHAKSPEIRIAAAAMAGFATLGLFDSLIDTPRLTCFALILAWLGLASRPSIGHHTQAAG